MAGSSKGRPSSGTQGTQPESSSRARSTHHPESAPLHGHIAHATRGRARFRVHARGDQRKLGQVADGLRTLPGVSNVELRTATGSLVIHHTSSNPEFLDHVRHWAADTGLLILAGLDDPMLAAKQATAVERDVDYLLDHSKTGKLLLRYAEHLNRVVKHSTDGWVDLRVLVPASAAACAVIFASVETAPLWVPLTLFSLQSFSGLHQPRSVLAKVQSPAAEAAAFSAGPPKILDGGSTGAAATRRKRSLPASAKR